MPFPACPGARIILSTLLLRSLNFGAGAALQAPLASRAAGSGFSGSEEASNLTSLLTLLLCSWQAVLLPQHRAGVLLVEYLATDMKQHEPGELIPESRATHAPAAQALSANLSQTLHSKDSKFTGELGCPESENRAYINIFSAHKYACTLLKCKSALLSS